MPAVLAGRPGGSGAATAATIGLDRRALRTHRVILLDQRGTGRSAPITPSVVRGRSASAIADYLALFLADSIVADAEHLRRSLIGTRPWDTLGQSYGGFVTLTYLSHAPDGLAHCYVAGGIPGLTATAADVYARTFSRAERRSREYYARYPDDESAMRRLIDYLDDHEVMLPDGDRLTARRLRTIGSLFGMSYDFETVHWLLESAWAAPDELRPSFLHDIATQTSFVDGALYALQEYVYAAGAATGWAAEREYEPRPEFAADARPVLFTAEIMFPWMFDELRSLRPFAEAATCLPPRPTGLPCTTWIGLLPTPCP